MKHLLAIVAAAALLAAPVAGFAAKPKRCLVEGEVRAEQDVRHGVFLREASARCEGQYVTGTKKLWAEFIAKAGDKLGKANDKRAKVYQREFPDDWKHQLTIADGRIVTYHRHYPLTGAYCKNVERLIGDAARKGYAAFAKQAATVQNEVISEYKTCPK